MRDAVMDCGARTWHIVDMSRPSISAERREQIGERVRRVRAALASTQFEFCQRLGVLPQTWNTYEQGRMPSDEALDKLYKLHGITSDYLRHGTFRGMPLDIVERLQSIEPPPRRKNSRRTTGGSAA